MTELEIKLGAKILPDFNRDIFLEKYAVREAPRSDMPMAPTIALEREPSEAFRRVAKALSEGFSKNVKAPFGPELEDVFYKVMAERRGIVAGRALLALGNPCVKLTALNCFVVPIDDAIESILGSSFEGASKIQQAGGGFGANFSNIRPKGAYVKGVNSTASGPLSFMDTWDSMIATMKSAGNRRGAGIAILDVNHPDILEFITAKQNKDLTNFNVSIGITNDFVEALRADKEYELKHNNKVYGKLRAKEVFEKIVTNMYNYNEPGIFFKDRVNEVSNTYYYQKIESTNPCVVGNTVVAVADGRNSVTIKQLSEEGKDVPVYCIDDKNNIVISMMRNPRITGYNEPIYKVTLDSGDIVRATGNHKFRLNNDNYIEVKDLKPGNSLRIIEQFEAPIERIIKNSNSKSQKYSWLKDGIKEHSVSAHRLIAAFYYNKNKRINTGFVVHHKDKNGLNNISENLEIMTRDHHHELHTELMLGENNPMNRFPEKNPWNNPEWQQKMRERNHIGAKRGKDTCEKISKKATERMTDEYKETISLGVSKFWNENKEELTARIMKTRVENKLKKYQKMTDLKCFIDSEHSGSVVVKKNCEECGKEFITPFTNRERAFCSIRCVALKNVKNQKGKSLSNEHKNKISKGLKNRVFSEEHKKNLTKANVRRWDKYHGITKQVSNHKVISVEIDGFENVYNGTVDNYHNFFVGGFESINEENDKKSIFINNLQCGEIPLPAWGCCDLGMIILPTFVRNPFVSQEVDIEGIKNTVRSLVFMLDAVLDVTNYPLKQNEKVAIQDRRIGLGITGLADMLTMLKITYDSDEAISFVDTLMQTIKNSAYEASVELAKLKGSFPKFDADKFLAGKFIQSLPDELKAKIKEYGIRNCALLTCQPAGTISLLLNNVSSGIEPIFSLKQKRRMRDDQGNLTRQFDLLDYSYKYYKSAGFDKVYGEKPSFFQTTKDVSLQGHLRMQNTIQKHVDNSISKTINFPEGTDTDTFRKFMFDVLTTNMSIKGLTTFREGTIQSILIDDDVRPETKQDVYRRRSFSYQIKRTSGLPSAHVHVTYNQSQVSQVFVVSRDVDFYKQMLPYCRLLSIMFNKEKNLERLLEILQELEDMDYVEMDEKFIYKNKEYAHFLSAMKECIWDCLVEIGLIKDEDDEIEETEEMECSNCHAKNSLVKDGKCFLCNVCGSSPPGASCSI